MSAPEQQVGRVTPLELFFDLVFVFTSSGLAFGIAYLVVVGVHTTLFTRSSTAGVVQAILRLAPYNLGSALVILVGGALGGPAQYVLWSLAVAFEWLTPVIRGNRG